MNKLNNRRKLIARQGAELPTFHRKGCLEKRKLNNARSDLGMNVSRNKIIYLTSQQLLSLSLSRLVAWSRSRECTALSTCGAQKSLIPIVGGHGASSRGGKKCMGSATRGALVVAR